MSASLTVLIARYARLVSGADLAALEAEVRRLADQPHVRMDAPLSLMLGLLVGRLRAMQEIAIGPTYRITTVPGAPTWLAIHCLLCDRVSDLPGDVANRYCGRCHLFHEAVERARIVHAEGGAHECHEWPTGHDVCAVCGAVITG